MKQLQLLKLNRATYNLLLDVSPMVDPENNVLQVPCMKYNTPTQTQLVTNTCS